MITILVIVTSIVEMNIDKELREWIEGNKKWSKMKKNKKNQLIEYKFSRNYYKGNSQKQWTSKFGEELVKTLLENTGEKVWYPDKNKFNFILDLETSKAIYEVKTRNWTTSGTAGEKILGVPFKYADMPTLYGKPLYIVLVGYQEYEAINKFGMFGGPKGSLKKNILMDLYKSWNIEFIKCSDLLSQFVEESFEEFKDEDNSIEEETETDLKDLDLEDLEEGLASLDINNS